MIPEVARAVAGRPSVPTAKGGTKDDIACFHSVRPLRQFAIQNRCCLLSSVNGDDARSRQGTGLIRFKRVGITFFDDRAEKAMGQPVVISPAHTVGGDRHRPVPLTSARKRSSTCGRSKRRSGDERIFDERIWNLHSVVGTLQVRPFSDDYALSLHILVRRLSGNAGPSPRTVATLWWRNARLGEAIWGDARGYRIAAVYPDLCSVCDLSSGSSIFSFTQEESFCAVVVCRNQSGDNQR